MGAHRELAVTAAFERLLKAFPQGAVESARQRTRCISLKVGDDCGWLTCYDTALANLKSAVSPPIGEMANDSECR